MQRETERAHAVAMEEMRARVRARPLFIERQEQLIEKQLFEKRFLFFLSNSIDILIV